MRLVQLANFYSSESGGLRVTIDRLRRGYSEAGIETTLIAPGLADADTRTPHGRVVHLAARPVPGSGGAYRLVTNRSALLRTLEEIRPDRIEVSDKTTMVAAARWAARNGVPSVLISHERLDAILAPRVPGWFPLRRATDRWNRWLSHQFDTIVCTSSFSAAEFSRVGAEHVHRVPLGVDLDVFRPRVSRAAPSSGIRLVSVGRLSAEKRPELAIEALRTLRHWGVPARLTMIGSGSMLDDLRRRSRDLAVDFVGHISDRDVLAGEMAAADVVIAPCPAESFGLAPLEAMACGTPVLVAAGSGAAELVGPGAGLAVPTGARAFARGVLEIMDLPRSDRRRAARARAESFPWERTIQRMLQIHRAVGSRTA